MTPRTAALAYRIWAYASPRGWDVTIPEIAEALDVSWRHVSGALQRKGWNSRVRHVSARGADSAYKTIGGSLDVNSANRAAERQAIREIVGTEGLPE